jgi:quercetin dioxygenase-like cupin family protein
MSNETNGDQLLSGLPNNTVHITGHTKDGLAKVHSSKPGEWQVFEKRNVAFNVVYSTSDFPADLNNDADINSHSKLMETGELGLVRPGGTVCRIVDFGPNGDPIMHRTQSLDYGVVLEGEMIMELDDGSKTLMKRGDVAVQRGTIHAWHNASKATWARMLFVLQDCKPVLINGERLEEDLSHAEGEIPKSKKDE